MHPVAWGVVLIGIGVLATFAHILGFLVGIPIMALGALLVVVGAVGWLLGLPFRAIAALRRGRDA